MAMRAVVCAVALMAVVVGCSAQLTATFPADDASIVTAATEALQGSLQDAYFGASVLGALGKQSAGYASCSAVQSALGAAESLEDMFYGVNALRSLNCDVKLKKSAKAVVAEALDSDELDSLYFAALTAAAAKKKSLKVDWARVVDAVGTLMDSGGTFRSNPEAKRSTAANAGRALTLLAASAKHVQSDADSMEILKTVTENVVSLLAGAEGSEATTLELGDVATTSEAVSGALALAAGAGVDIDVSAEQLTAFAAYFVAQRRARDPSTLFNVVRGLTALADNSVAVPVVVAVQDAVLADSTANPSLTVTVTDLFGAAVAASSVSATVTARDGSSVVEGEELAAAGDAYKLSLGADPLSAGVYSVELSVTPEDERYATPELSTSVKVTTVAVLGPAQIEVSSSSQPGSSKASKATATFPKAASGSVKASSGQHLHVELSITSKASGQPIQPHQVFLRLTNKASGVATIFVAAPGSDGKHRLALDISDRSTLHDAAAAGSYELHAIIGDSVIQNPSVWKLADVELTPPAPQPKADKPLYAEPLLHTSDTTTKALPEIHHQFRQPDSRPPAAVSMAFTALCLLPFAGMLIGMASRGGNLRALPTGAGFIFAVGFHASLGAILVLFALYWLQLNMFQTLGYLAPLAVSAVFFGHRLLSNLAHASVARSQKVKSE